MLAVKNTGYKNAQAGAIVVLMNKENDDVTKFFNSRPQKEALAPEDFDIVVDTKTSQVWVLHGTAFMNQANIARAEYNTQDHSLRFISRDGGIQYLGAKVQDSLQPHLAQAKEIKAILVDDGHHIKDIIVVELRQKN